MPHTEQCLPAVRPSFSQVGLTSLSITTVWGIFSIAFSETTLLQIEHTYSILPVSLQVASLSTFQIPLCITVTVVVTVLPFEEMVNVCSPAFVLSKPVTV